MNEALLPGNEGVTRETLSSHLSAIVESSDDAIISKDLTGVIRTWNKGAERIFGYTPGEIIGKSVTVLIPPGREDEEPNIISRIRAGERIEHYETVRRRKDGTLVNISLAVSPIKDAGGKVIGASKIARDITERKRAEELQKHFSAIVESSDDAILSKDLNGVIRSWNNGAANIFGYQAHEVIGQPVTMLMPPDRVNEEPNILAKIRAGERVEHYETVRRRKDGSLIDISLSVSPIRDASGTVIGASKIVRDISFQKKADELIRKTREELIAANESLEEKVRERTASLNAALLQMQEFSYTVSHDLRGPVRAMLGYAKIILDDYAPGLDPTVIDYLNRMVRGGKRMDTLIHDVLTYSRLAQQEIASVRISLEAVVRDIFHHYPELQPPAIQAEIASPLLDVMGNETLLTQAFSNLFSNSRKFVADGVTPRVHISTESHEDRVRVWIKDNGIGIDAQSKARLFGMFQRGKHSVKYEGTGIGLAIVRKAVEKMSGTVGVESDGANGSSFWIDLPAAK